MLELFLKGILIGLAIAAPIGPMSILCMHRTLHEGFRVGFLSGVGFAFADGTCGLIIGLGLTALSHFLIQYQFWLRLLGSLFLMYLGIQFIRMRTDAKSRQTQRERSSLHAFTTAYILALTSPVTILLFIAVFAGLGIGTFHTSMTHALSLVSGIIMGSTSWWIVFCTGLRLIHKKLNPNIMKLINIVSGLVLVGFGLSALI